MKVDKKLKLNFPNCCSGCEYLYRSFSLVACIKYSKKLKNFCGLFPARLKKCIKENNCYIVKR